MVGDDGLWRVVNTNVGTKRCSVKTTEAKLMHSKGSQAQEQKDDFGDWGALGWKVQCSVES